MNAVEIEEAVSRLAEAAFDAKNFPYSFLEAFGNKETTLKRLRSGTTNQSDLPGGVLQRNNIHIIGRRFKNDTERLEKLFEMYTQMVAKEAAPKKPRGRKKKAGDG